METTAVLVSDHRTIACVTPGPAPLNWQLLLPVLTAGDVVLREVQATDAPVLSALLTTPEITRFISPPPSSIDGFERFIAGSQRLRAAGEGACFAVTMRGCDTAIGIFQVRRTAPSDAATRPFSGVIDTAEWGFALGSPFWGTGLFEQGARLVVDFAFAQMQIHRLEARCAAKNGRGGQALRKVGATPEGVLRKAFLCGDQYLDQVLYTIVATDWRARREASSGAMSARH